MKHFEKVITPQQVYGTVEGTCRDCRFCVTEKDTGRISTPFYCIRFFARENPKSRINAYDTACGKFERQNQCTET